MKLRLFCLVLGLASVAEASDRSNCPCLEPEDIPTIANFSGPSYMSRLEYGAGCHKHDKGTDRCINHGPDSYWCESEWCYVDPLYCDLPFRKTTDFPHSMRFFSYAACGFIDEWDRDPNNLKGEFYMGTICNENSCSGPVVDLVNYLVEYELDNVTIDFTYSVSEEISNRSQAYQPFLDNNEDVDHAACVYASGSSAVDLCIGAFTKNRHRSAVSPYIELGVTSEYLIVSKSEAEQNPQQMIRKIFEPFTWELWVVTFAVLILLSLLFAVQESPMNWWMSFKEAPLSATADTVYNASLRFWAQGAMLPTDSSDSAGSTWAARFTLLAIGVQILLTGASYTANLTSFLVTAGLEPSVKGMEDAIGRQLKVCVLRNKITILEETFGNNRIRYAKADDGQLGFLEREDLLNAMDRGICSCAVAGLDEMDTYHGSRSHCDKIRVGDPIIELPWGVPVSEKYAAPLNTAIAKLMQEGNWRNMSDYHRPESRCEDEVVDMDTHPLGPKHLLGAYVLSAALVVFGVFISAVLEYGNGMQGLPHRIYSRRHNMIANNGVERHGY